MLDYGEKATNHLIVCVASSLELAKPVIFAAFAQDCNIYASNAKLS